jgi:DNA-binding beta-propeller fold protein YncE
MWIAVWSEKKIISMSLKGKILATVETDSQPEAVRWTGTQLWATLAGTAKSWNNKIIAVDGDANIMDTFTVGKAPLNLAWNADEEIVYVSNYASNTVTALDADGQVIGTYKVGPKPTGLVWDGEHLWVALSGEKAVAALDSDGKVIAKIPFDNAPEQLASDGENIWVTNAGDFDNPGNSVTRINIQKALSATE